MIKHIQDYIYGVEIYMIVEKDVSKCWNMVLKRSKLHSPTKEDFFKTFKDSTAFVTPLIDQKIFLIIPDRQKILCGTFAHESLHIMHSVMDNAGMKLNDETEEAYAYYIGWLFNELYYIKKGKK